MDKAKMGQNVLNKNLTGEWIRQKEPELLFDLASLIGIPSVSDPDKKEAAAPFGPSCRKALHQMLDICRKKGFDVREYDGYCGELRWGPETEHEQGIAFLGHLDVVPAGAGWIYPPFQLTRIGDYLIGRGTQDNKGPLTAVLYAFWYLKEQGYVPKHTLRLWFGCDEERGMEDAAYFLKRNAAPDLSIVADCGFPVCRGEKGMLGIVMSRKMQETQLAELEAGQAANIVPDKACAVLKNGSKVCADGISGHAAFPDGTKNAVGSLCRQLLEEKGDAYHLSDEDRQTLRFLELFAEDGYGTNAGLACSDDASGPLTCNLGCVRLHDGNMSLHLDIRYPVTKTGDDIRKILNEAAQKYGFVIASCHEKPSYCYEPDDALVKMLMDVYQTVTGDGKQSYVMGGGTYAKYFPGAVGFGPGMPWNGDALKLPEGHGNCHSADEVQVLSNLEKAMEIYITAVYEADQQYETLVSGRKKLTM